MSILNISIDLIAETIDEIHGAVDFALLKQFEKNWLLDGFDEFKEHLNPNSEWCELMLTYVPAETLDGRVTAPEYYEFEVLKEGTYGEVEA